MTFYFQKKNKWDSIVEKYTVPFCLFFHFDILRDFNMIS